MTDALSPTDVAAFFDDFVVAFAQMDGPLIAHRYHVPYLAIHADGRHDLFTSAEAVGVYFQRIVDAYRRDGCRTCRYRDLAVVPLGADAVLATVTWDLIDTAGAVTSSWTESYNLLRIPDGLRVYASTDH